MVTKGWSFNGGFNGEEEEENGNVREREKKASEILG